MKTYILVISLLLSGTALGAPAKKATTPRSSSNSLPVFEFKGVRAGEPVDPTIAGTCSPTDDGIPGNVRCRGSDDKVAGVELMLAPSYYFYNGRLTTMLYLYDSKSGLNYLTFLGAFREKYGKPCASESEKWQSKGGATFDNATATWCFKTGKLKLEQIGPSRDDGIVTYTDDYSAPAKETPKDF